ncbi:lipase member K-like [Sitophilus oryzae]|uniref:Lipase n=1 Tax=Sitophilus oryzae TaxID=7048 RepID=A0A6J2X3D4_SITOR|nr:lipase member K-like [Sitophilus oryzae]
MARCAVSTLRVLTMWFISLMVLAVLAGGGVDAQANNVCPTFDDYYTMQNNTNCWYDLGADYVAPEIIHLLGYPVETHRVVTRDGYILTIFRIPNDGHKNPHARKHPVYLQHGLVATCNNFLALQKDSLAFVLWEAGYDVWLGNYRGTFYSEEHLNLTVRDQQFWDMSMDEVALIDLPAIFHTILSHSEEGSQIIYVGHSLGTTFALMYGSEFPEEARNVIKMFVLLCPAYTLTNMISPYKIFAPYGDWVVETVMELRLQRIVSQSKELGRLINVPCMESPPLMRVCMQLYNLFYGAKADFGPEIIPVYFRQLPGGTSIKILNHAADLVLGNFRKYNYPPHINFLKYGTKEAPLFDVSKIQVPTYIVYSTQDWATPEADARNLYRNLNEKARHGIRKIDLPEFNHIDFVMGRHARQVVYDPLVRVINDAIIPDDYGK